MWNLGITVILFAAVVFGQGCCSILSDGSELISVDSNPSGAKIKIGPYSGVTPYTVKVPRGKDYTITAEYNGVKKVVSLERTIQGLYWANILIWPGLIVDAATQKMYRYDPSEYVFDFHPLANDTILPSEGKTKAEEAKPAKITEITQETGSTTAEETDSVLTEFAEPAEKAESSAVATPVRPTSTPVPFAIKDPKFEAAYKGQCDTDATITSVDGDSFGAGGQISIRDGALTLWCYGAKHTWKGKLTYADHVFDSDSENPLQFMVDKDKGYVYLGGKGAVTMPDGTVVQLPAEPAEKAADRQLPQNGTIHTYSNNVRIAPLSIKTGGDKVHYFVKLTDWNTNTPVQTIFIRAGHSAETTVPLGSYRFKYAAGETWLGENKLFGDETVFSKAEKRFDFTQVGNYVSGHSVELILQTGGNLSTVNIPKSEW